MIMITWSAIWWKGHELVGGSQATPNYATTSLKNKAILSIVCGKFDQVKCQISSIMYDGQYDQLAAGWSAGVK